MTPSATMAVPPHFQIFIFQRFAEYWDRGSGHSGEACEAATRVNPVFALDGKSKRGNSRRTDLAKSPRSGIDDFIILVLEHLAKSSCGRTCIGPNHSETPDR